MRVPQKEAELWAETEQWEFLLPERLLADLRVCFKEVWP